MSESRWTGLVYGRSYQIDFNSIATPEDFSDQDIQWALKYITATTRSADRLDGNPRWSLFKNENHCVIGVTCTVKDLLGDRSFRDDTDFTKDCQGRPLYIFVGYVTQLNDKKYLPSIPPYTGNNLELFEPLYQHVRDIWFLKDYEKFDKLPITTSYQQLTYSEFQSTVNYDVNLAQRLNHLHKNQDLVCLWNNSDESRKKLWATAAKCKFPISLCLGLKGEADAISSPFLNGTSSSIALPCVLQRTSNAKAVAEKNDPSLSELVSNKVQDDIKVTIQQVEKAIEVGQGFMQSVTNNAPAKPHLSKLSSPTNPSRLRSSMEEFGFKAKPKPKEEIERSDNSSESWF
jgi:hypothetical protein